MKNILKIIDKKFGNAKNYSYICSAKQLKTMSNIQNLTDMANNYFVCNRNGIRSLYKTASRCNKMNKLSTLHNVVPMVQMTMVDENGNIYREWVEKTNAVVTPLVFGTIKGYVVPITDAEIWEFIDKNLSAAERAKDFKVLRAEFDRPNDSDVECWHRSGATIATCELWTPFDKIPTDLVFD